MGEGLRVLINDQAVAACVLWASGQFNTAEIGRLLGVPEDAVCRTLHMARDAARARDQRKGWADR